MKDGRLTVLSLGGDVESNRCDVTRRVVGRTQEKKASLEIELLDSAKWRRRSTANTSPHDQQQQPLPIIVY